MTDTKDTELSEFAITLLELRVQAITREKHKFEKDYDPQETVNRLLADVAMTLHAHIVVGSDAKEGSKLYLENLSGMLTLLQTEAETRLEAL